MRGYVAGLSGIPALAVQCGHWDERKNYLEPNYVSMVLRVVRIEAGSDERYRGGYVVIFQVLSHTDALKREIAIWLYTKDNMYACQFPHPTMEKRWEMALRINGVEGLKCRDIKLAGVRPFWWPIVAQAAWNKVCRVSPPHNKTYRFGAARLDHSDFCRLDHGQKLNDEIVNFWMEIIRARGGSHVFNSFFFSKLPNYQAVRSWTKKVRRGYALII